MERRQYRSLQKEGRVRRNVQRNAGQKQQCFFIYDPETFCSDSNSSVTSSDISNLTDTKTNTILNPVQDCVVLSDSEDDEGQALSPPVSAQAPKRIVAPTIKAVDTLKMLRGGKEAHKRSYRHLNSHSENRDSDGSIVSAPRSPPSAFYLHQCISCRRLFSKVKKQKSLKKQKRSTDPASLSCDEWVLKKKWRPQKWQQVRGRLWVHLKRIRAQSAVPSDSDKGNPSWVNCCRPHIFLQRNIRRCMETSTLTKATSRKRQSRAKPASPPWPVQHRQQKKKTSINDSIFPQTSPLDYSINTRSETVPVTSDVYSYQHDNVLEEHNKDVTICLRRTRRVLKFDEFSNIVPEKPQKRVQDHEHNSSAAKKHADVSLRNCAGQIDDSVWFTTPTDLSNVESEVTQTSRPSGSSSKQKRRQKNNFRSMLAVLEKKRSQIIKESNY